MKKIFAITLSYITLAFLICFALSFFVGKLPVLIPGDTFSFIFHRACKWFFIFFNAICCSAFLVSCSIHFGHSSGRAVMRFSSTMYKHFKSVIISSILLVALMTAGNEILRPLSSSKLELLVEAPRLVYEYLQLGNEADKKGNAALAYTYALGALKLDPSNERADKLLDRATSSIRQIKPAKPKKANSSISYSEYVAKKEMANETVTSLLDKARSAMGREKWFEAHYYAQLAVAGGSDLDINIKEARLLAADAWNKLVVPEGYKRTEEQIIFGKKVLAYQKLMDGDSIGAYYDFLDIYQTSAEPTKDPDIERFMEVAKARMEDECFFIDETENLERFENYKDVYFRIERPDGRSDVIYINGITVLKNSGRMIQYLRDFNMFSYNEEGMLLSSVRVPYAKMTGKDIEKETKNKKPGKVEYKRVPFVILHSVDRNLSERQIFPKYYFDPSLAAEDRKELNAFQLSISLDEFNMICDSSRGASDMNLLSLIRIFPRAKSYGYSPEIFGAALVRRFINPMVLLILLVLFASLGWNYRLEENQLFKFIWILVVPICTGIMYLLLECVIAAVEFVNYALVALAGRYALIISLILSVFLLIIVSVLFLARTSD